MPLAPRAYLVTQDPACLTIHGKITEFGRNSRLCVDSACRDEEFLFVRQLLGLRDRCMLSCVAVKSPPPLCRAFSLSLSLPPPMIEGSMSQRSLKLRTKKFSRSLPLSLHSSRQLPEMFPDRHLLYHRQLGLSHCKIHCGDGPLLTLQRGKYDVRCVDATSQYRSFTPWCWWEM